MNKIYSPLCFLLQQTLSPVTRAQVAHDEISRVDSSVSLLPEDFSHKSFQDHIRRQRIGSKIEFVRICIYITYHCMYKRSIHLHIKTIHSCSNSPHTFMIFLLSSSSNLKMNIHVFVYRNTRK